MAAKFAKVQGLPELLSKLRDLHAPKTIDGIAYKGTFGSAKELKTLARENAMAMTEERSHALERSFAQKKIKVGFARGYTVGVRSGNKRPGDLPLGQGKNAGNDPYYWWWLEFGTIKGKVKRPGFGFYRTAIQTLQPKWLGQIQAAGMKAVLKAGNSALKRFGNGKATPK